MRSVLLLSLHAGAAVAIPTLIHAPAAAEEPPARRASTAAASLLAADAGFDLRARHRARLPHVPRREAAV